MNKVLSLAIKKAVSDFKPKIEIKDQNKGPDLAWQNPCQCHTGIEYYLIQMHLMCFEANAIVRAVSRRNI